MTLVGQELDRHGKFTLRAIESGRVDVALRRMKAYIGFAESFLGTASSRALRFSEAGSLPVSLYDWPIPVQIGRLAREAVVAAVGSQNAELFSYATELPVRIMEKSVRHGEFFFYLEMLETYADLLSLSYQSILASSRGLIVKYSRDPLRRFCNSWLIQQTEEYQPRLRARYVSRALWVYHELMRVAMDRQDPDTFGILAREFRDLFEGRRRLGRSGDLPRDLREVVSIDRRQVWFELGAWAARGSSLGGGGSRDDQSEGPIIDDLLVPQFLSHIGPRARTLKELSEAYLRSISLHDDISLVEHGNEGTAERLVFQPPAVERWRARHYALEGTRLVLGGAKDNPSEHQLLRFGMDEIESMAEELKDTPRRWSHFIPNLGITPTSEGETLSVDTAVSNAVDWFVEANRSAIRAWDCAREDNIIAADLDDQKTKGFKDECISGWLGQSWLERLLERRGQVRESALDPGLDRIFFRFLAPKDIFMENLDAQSFGFGQGYGSELADDVNKILLSEVRSRCQALGPVDLHAVPAEVASRARELEQPLIVVFGSAGLENQFFVNSEFVPPQEEASAEMGFSGHAYLGRLGDTPVFRILEEPADEVLVVSPPELGTLLRRIHPEYNYKGLRISVEPLERADAEGIISRDAYALPENLVNPDGSLDSPEEAIRWIRMRVRVTVGANLEWESPGKSPGFVIQVDRPGGPV